MNMKFASYVAVSTGLVFLTGCSQINRVFDNKESVNYTTAKTVSSLEVPPDLTAPQYDSTFEVNSGKVSASSINKAGAVGSSPVNENILTGSTIKRKTASESKQMRHSVESEKETEKTGRNIDSEGYGVGKSGAAKKATVSANTNNGRPSLTINNSFDSAWTRTGVALTDMGFLVDGQDRAKGLYLVKWKGYTKEGKSISEQVQQIFSFKKEILEEGVEQIIHVKNVGNAGNNHTVIQVFNKDGKPAQLDIAKKVLDSLRKELNR